MNMDLFEFLQILFYLSVFSGITVLIRGYYNILEQLKKNKETNIALFNSIFLFLCRAHPEVVLKLTREAKEMMGKNDVNDDFLFEEFGEDFKDRKDVEKE